MSVAVSLVKTVPRAMTERMLIAARASQVTRALSVRQVGLVNRILKEK